MAGGGVGVTLFSGGMEGDQSLPTQYKGGDCRKLIPIKGGVNKNITEPYGGTQPHLPTPMINNEWSLSQSYGKT